MKRMMPTTSLMRHGSSFGRALVLLAVSHLFVSVAAADECRSCKFSRGVPRGLWEEFSESLAALDQFTLADKALAERLAIIAGRPPATAGNVIDGNNLQRFSYPWRPELFHDPGAPGTADQAPEAADDSAPQPTSHESAFFAAVREFEQPFDPITADKLRDAVESWRVYRDAACRLGARFKKIKGAKTDASCVRAFGDALLAALPTLQQWNLESMDPPFDELPPIDLEQHPKLHYVELDGRRMPGGSTFSKNGRRTTTVRVTDTSGPLILFLRAHDATHWQITVEPGVDVQHVFLFGQNKQTTTVSGQAASIRSYSNEQHNSDRLWRVLYKGDDDLAAMATALDTLIGVRPTSMQSGCKNARCEITGDLK